MRSKRKEQEIKDRIVALRNKKRAVDLELKNEMLNLYIEMGVHPDHAVKML